MNFDPQNTFSKRLRKALPNSIENSELQLAYQPICELSTKKCRYVEALLRWRFDNIWVPPKIVLSLLEQNDLLIAFHKWLFQEALQQQRFWQMSYPALKMALNISSNVFDKPTIIENLKQTAKKFKIKPSTLVIEIAESDLSEDPEISKNFTSQLCSFGVQIAIDDFSGNQLTIDALPQFSCTKLKLNKNLFSGYDASESKQNKLKPIAKLGQNLGIEVIAKGIENKSFAHAAKKSGCRSGQGFWYSKPQFGIADWDTFLMHASVHTN